MRYMPIVKMQIAEAAVTEVVVTRTLDTTRCAFRLTVTVAHNAWPVKVVMGPSKYVRA
jgi:hypothetical protein